MPAKTAILASARLIQICGAVQSTYSTFDKHEVPVSVVEWTKIIEKRLSARSGKPFSISVQSFPSQGDQIKGVLKRCTFGAEVYFSEKETLCWQRYITAKELAHLLMDTPSEYTQRPSNLMEQLISGVPLWLLRKDHTQEDAAFESENMAMITAIEMLMPWKHRPLFQRLCDEGKDNSEIAEIFKVPRNVVSNMLTPTYSASSTNANNFIVENLTSGSASSAS